MSQETLIIAIIMFILIFFVSYLLNIFKLGVYAKEKVHKILEVRYLCIKFNIREETLLNKGFLLFTSLINSLIMTGVFLVIELLDMHIMFRLMIGFILLLGLIYSIYGILGKFLERRGN